MRAHFGDSTIANELAPAADMGDVVMGINITAFPTRKSALKFQQSNDCASTINIVLGFPHPVRDHGEGTEVIYRKLVCGFLGDSSSGTVDVPNEGASSAGAGSRGSFGSFATAVYYEPQDSEDLREVSRLCTTGGVCRYRLASFSELASVNCTLLGRPTRPLATRGECSPPSVTGCI